MKLSKKIQAKLLLQTSISFVIFPWLYFFYWVFLFIIKKYKIKQLAKARAKFHKITKKIDTLLIICANHLSYIDSIIMTVIFHPWWRYWLHFKQMPWNFPKTTHIKHNIFYKIITYIGKCILLNLEGPKEQVTTALNIAKQLLVNKEYIMLFPEGHRGNNGRVDTENFAYGVGKLINHSPNTKVLCVYLRGDQQQQASNFPPANTKFTIDFKLIDPWGKLPLVPTSELKTARELAKNIVLTLAAMEKVYFANV